MSDDAVVRALEQVLRDLELIPVDDLKIVLRARIENLKAALAPSREQ